MYITIDRISSVTITHQVYTAIKNAILDGRMAPGEKLPSTRDLAKDLHIARNITIECYEQLTSEGYTYSKSGSGTFVSKGVQYTNIPPASVVPSITGSSTPTAMGEPAQPVISFRTGIPDLSMIPIQKWGTLYKKIAASMRPEQLDYQSSSGDRLLREQLVLYLHRARGVCTSPDNIIITNGAAQSFSLLCSLISPDGYALVENPLSYGILNTLQSNHVAIQPIGVDDYGMMTSTLPSCPPQLIFTTPSHQFPTGVILPVNRRIELLTYAEHHKTYVVEDDYDSEFRFDGSPIQSMQQLNPQRVVYVGTFSKTLMPALRLGYMVLPDELVHRLYELKYVADLHTPTLEQLTLSQFISSGMYERHIRKMNHVYLKKRNNLIYSLQAAFGQKVTISGAQAGLHFAASFQGIHFTDALMTRIHAQGIEICPMRHHYLDIQQDSRYDDSLLFGYGNASWESIYNGPKKLYTLLYEGSLPV